MTRPAAIDWDDPSLLIEIENAVADGADSCPKIAKAIGVSDSSLRSRMFLRKTSSPKMRASINTINTAIKKGKARRRSAIRAAATDGLLRLVSGFSVVDTIEHYRCIQDPGDPDKTIKQPTGGTRTKKHFAPNATAVIFALCNADGENFKSILRVAAEDGDKGSKGLVVDWMKQQIATGKKFSKESFPGIDDDPAET